MQKGVKKTAVADEWRSSSVEERLEHSLIKVNRTCKCQALSQESTNNIQCFPQHVMRPGDKSVGYEFSFVN